MAPSNSEMIDWVYDAYVDWKVAKDAGNERARIAAVHKLATKLATAHAPLDLLDDIPHGALTEHFMKRSIH